MRGRLLMGTMVFLCLVGLVALPAQAQEITGTLSNFDVKNDTGYTANDFHLELDGVSSSDVNSLWTGSYPNLAMSGSGDLVIDWTGATTANGATAHFGVGLDGDDNPSAFNAYWTLNGAKLGTGRQGGFQDWFLSGGQVQDVILNPVGSPTLWIQRRTNTSNGLIGLGDLLVGGALWNGATLLDNQPVQLLAGASLTYNFPALGPITQQVNEVMMYDVFADNSGAPGPLQMTFLNAASVVPEPGTLSLLGAGAIMVLLYAWRRKR